jgi:hypothetical protein
MSYIPKQRSTRHSNAILRQGRPDMITHIFVITNVITYNSNITDYEKEDYKLV